MMILAVLMVCSGVGVTIQMIVWAIQTWREATIEERRLVRFEENSNLVSFEDFSKMMRETTNLKLGK